MLSAKRVISERYPNVANNKLLHRPATAVLKHLFCEQQINQFAEQYPHLSSFDFVEQVLAHLSFTYRLNSAQKEHIPDSGRVIIIANHPIGSLDGLALVKCVKEVRSDVKVIANELLMEIEPLHEILLPVNNMQGNTPKQNLQNISKHLESEGAVIVFPAGEVSRLRPQGVRDTKWHSGFLRIAKSNKCPIVPIYINAKNSALFYGVSMLYKPAATALLVKEMFHQKNKHIDMTIGELIPYSSFAAMPLNVKEQVKLFKKHLYQIGKNKDGVFQTQRPIAPPEERRELYKALKNECELLGESADEKLIYLYKHTSSSPIMRELGRLREVTFRAVGEGTNERRDVDKYDKSYFHLILWDKNELEIAGAYRFADAKALHEQNKSLYSETLFDYNESMHEYFAAGLELGRSFVQQKYWGKRSLDYLWIGIGAFIRKHPQYRYLFGPVTLSAQLPKAAVDLITQFFLHFFPDNDHIANAKLPYITTLNEQHPFVNIEYKEAQVLLKSSLASLNVSLPTLYKQYGELCENNGVRFTAFNIDPDFQDCIDGLVMVDLQKLKPKKRKRYLGN
ncbi:MAG: lysophospholipid acyltransferase family protein [Glaciecola sp.]